MFFGEKKTLILASEANSAASINYTFFRILAPCVLHKGIRAPVPPGFWALTPVSIGRNRRKIASAHKHIFLKLLVSAKTVFELEHEHVKNDNNMIKTSNEFEYDNISVST